MPIRCWRLKCASSGSGATATKTGISLPPSRAISPTERAALQTADIARRQMRGGELHQDVGAS
jgi:hypothetical protein